MARFGNILRNLFANIDRIEKSVLLRLNAEMQQRIFNRGLASDESPMGPYRSASHRKRRQNAGRQVNYKDLEFTSDLRRSIVLGRLGRRNVIGFSNNRNRIKAAGNEQQIGKRVFGTSRSERRLIRDIIRAEIRATYGRR